MLLMVGWVLMAALRIKLGDSDGHMSAFNGESLTYLIGNVIPWCINVLYLLLNFTGTVKRFLGGDINIQLGPKFTCSTCNNVIRKNQTKERCVLCNSVCHINCLIDIFIANKISFTVRIVSQLKTKLSEIIIFTQ